MEPEIRYGADSGFTLVELIIVVMIMSVFLMIVVPKIESNTSINLNRSVRRLAGAVLFTRNESVFKKKDLRIEYDLDENSYSVKQISMTDEGLMQEDYSTDGAAVVELEEGVSFMDVSTANGGKVTYGKAYTHVYSSSVIEKTVIHLMSENDAVKTIDINALTGEADTYDDYKDFIIE